jgi:hypothetical protein
MKMKKLTIRVLAAIGSLTLILGIILVSKYVCDSVGVSDGYQGDGRFGNIGFSLKSRVTQAEVDKALSDFQKQNASPPGMIVKVILEEHHAGQLVNFVQYRRPTFYQDVAFLDNAHSWYVDSLIGYMIARGTLVPEEASPHCWARTDRSF